MTGIGISVHGKYEINAVLKYLETHGYKVSSKMKQTAINQNASYISVGYFSDQVGYAVGSVQDPGGHKFAKENYTKIDTAEELLNGKTELSTKKQKILWSLVI